MNRINLVLKFLQKQNGDRLIAAVLMTNAVSKPLEEKVPEVAEVQEEKKADDTESFSNVIDSTAESLKRKKQALLDREGERIRGEYGAQLSDDDVIKVINMEDEMNRCKQCNGKTCLKIRNLGEYKTAHWDEESKALKIVSSKCQRHMQARFNLSQIPLEYIGKTFDDYVVDTDNEYAVEVAKKLVESPNRGVYFYGRPGTGKTFLASILAQEVIKHGRNVIFTTVPSLSAKIRSTFQKNSKLTETDILEKLYTVPTLILDDIGIEKPTRFVCSTICNIFNERYNARRQTIMTSNYPLKALENLLLTLK